MLKIRTKIFMVLNKNFIGALLNWVNGERGEENLQNRLVNPKPFD